MPLTRHFKETVAARVQKDPAFAQALLDEAITLFVDGEPSSRCGRLQRPHTVCAPTAGMNSTTPAAVPLILT